VFFSFFINLMVSTPNHVVLAYENFCADDTDEATRTGQAI
jgi:hypothetical protein